MGIINYFVTAFAKEVAKDVTIGAAFVAVDGIDKLSSKGEAIKRSRLLKTKRREKSLLISVTEDDKTFWTKKTKARHYTVQENENVKYNIKRVLKAEGTSIVEIRDSMGKVVGSINELIKHNIPMEHIFMVSQNDAEIGRVLANDVSPYRYVTSHLGTWDIVRNEKEFLISKDGKAIAKCKNYAHKLRRNSLSVKYNEDEPESSILFIATCLFLMLDVIKR